MSRRITAEEAIARAKADPSWWEGPPEARAIMERAYRRDFSRGAYVKEFFSAAWRLFGLFNTDPYIARISLIQEAGRQIDTQREISAGNRAEDQTHAVEQARLQGQAMADAMIERLEERGFKQ